MSLQPAGPALDPATARQAIGNQAVDNEAAAAGHSQAERRRRRMIFAAWALVLIIVGLPLLLTQVPPLFDYPNHLGRMHILADGGHNPALAAYYQIAWAPLPNLAMDLAVPLLNRWFAIDTAGRLFVYGVLVVQTLGVMALHRAVWRRWSAWPLTVLLLLYGRTFLWGFLNYLCGIGWAFLALACWRRAERRPVARVLGTALLGFCAYFSHLMGFALLAIMIGGSELPALWREARARDFAAAFRRCALAAAPLLPVVALALATWRPGDGVGFNWTAPSRKFDLLFSVFDNYSRPFDVACFAAVVIALGIAFYRRRLRVDHRLGAAWICVFIFYLLVPSQGFGGSGADHRLPVALFMLGIAALEPVPVVEVRAGGRWIGRRAVTMALVLLALVRMSIVAAVWHRADTEYQPMLAAFDRLPEGGKLAIAYTPNVIGVVPVPFPHLAAEAVVRRDVYIATQFAYPGQQPLVYQPYYQALSHRSNVDFLWNALFGTEPKRSAARQVLAGYDALYLAGSSGLPPIQEKCLLPIYIARQAALFRIRPHCFGE